MRIGRGMKYSGSLLLLLCCVKERRRAGNGACSHDDDDDDDNDLTVAAACVTRAIRLIMTCMGWVILKNSVDGCNNGVFVCEEKKPCVPNFLLIRVCV